MTFNPLKEKGLPLEKQVRNWSELAGRPYDKEEVDPYTRCRIILMNALEVEAALFLHEFNRMEKRPELKEQLALQRRIEQQQQKAVSGLIPGNESILEHTIGYEQVAVDLTAYLARTVTDPYVKQVFDFGLLEDFDHLYRYANLMETMEGKQAHKLVHDYTEVMPGRPTIVEHRHPFDSLRAPLDRKKADPGDLLSILTLVAAEQQTMNFYMNMANRITDPVGRGLYIEIGMIEEQHVSQYESLLDPRMDFFEMMVCHEYNECYLYHSFMEKELDPRIRKLWELHLDMELGHLRNAVELMGKYTQRDAEELLPKRLPPPIVFEPNIKYVREVLESQVNLTAVGMDFKPVEQVPPGYRYFEYQNMVNGHWVPSEEVIEEHVEKFGEDYRLDLTDGERTARVRPPEYYRTKTRSKDIFALLNKEHNEVKMLFQKIRLAAAGRDALFSELAENLSLHMEGEEQLFYSRLEESDELKDLMVKGYEEHEEARSMLKDMVKLPVGENEWPAKISLLHTLVEHHIADEEGELFIKAHKEIGPEESEEIAKNYQMKEEIAFQTTPWIKEKHDALHKRD